MVAISLDCGCKGRCFFENCNRYNGLFLLEMVIFLLKPHFKYVAMVKKRKLKMNSRVKIYDDFIAITKESIAYFKLLVRKLRYFAINSYFCQLKTRKL